MKKAIYSGSFDPITIGHLDIIERSSKIFDEILVIIAKNGNKQQTFSSENRVSFTKKATTHLTNVNVIEYCGLITNYASEHGYKYLIRGLRNESDFEAENILFQYNHDLQADVETIYFMQTPNKSYISSSGVKEILAHNGDVSKYLPPIVYKSILQLEKTKW